MIMSRAKNLTIFIIVILLGCTNNQESKDSRDIEKYPSEIINNHLEEAFDEAKWILYKSNYALGNRNLCYAILGNNKEQECDYDLLTSELRSNEIYISEDTLNFTFSFNFYSNDSLLKQKNGYFYCYRISYENKIPVEMGCLGNSTIRLDSSFNYWDGGTLLEAFLIQNQNKLDPWLSDFWQKKKNNKENLTVSE
jgi:hypothetical protein